MPEGQNLSLQGSLEGQNLIFYVNRQVNGSAGGSKPCKTFHLEGNSPPVPLPGLCLRLSAKARYRILLLMRIVKFKHLIKIPHSFSILVVNGGLDEVTLILEIRMIYTAKSTQCMLNFYVIP